MDGGLVKLERVNGSGLKNMEKMVKIDHLRLYENFAIKTLRHDAILVE